MAKKYYAVKCGKGGVSGVYLTWEDCKAQVEGVPGVKYKGFPTMEEAEAFLNGEGAKPVKQGKAAPPEPYLDGAAVAYVDGSYNEKTKEFSCGVVLFYNRERIDFSRKHNDASMAEMRNVAGEIMGAVLAVRYCLAQEIPVLEVHHDYEGVAKWASGQWKANKPGTQAYAAFCRKAREKLELRFVKVRGHSGDYWNDEADRLAKEALGLA